MIVESSPYQVDRSNACESTGIETDVFGQSRFGCNHLADGANIRERNFETGAQLVFAKEVETSDVSGAKAVALRRS